MQHLSSIRSPGTSRAHQLLQRIGTQSHYAERFGLSLLEDTSGRFCAGNANLYRREHEGGGWAAAAMRRPGSTRQVALKDDLNE